MEPGHVLRPRDRAVSGRHVRDWGGGHWGRNRPGEEQAVVPVGLRVRHAWETPPHSLAGCITWQIDGNWSHAEMKSSQGNVWAEKRQQAWIAT